MSKKVVAVVGRPNVGKSTLFNKIAGKRISIVEDTPGVTRDRIYVDVDWLAHNFTLIDTGGLAKDEDSFMMRKIYEQAQIAIDTADVIMFVVDVKTGIVEGDIEVANLLRKSKKPIVLVVNKVDNMRELPPEVYEFYSLGIGEPIAVSAGQALGLGDMLDAVVAHFGEVSKGQSEDHIQIAVVGKPNVGKSSLINKILGKDRLIVSDVAGTTRDAIDTYYEKDGQKYILIDTAGIRRKNKIKENSIERFSIVRAVAAVERADVCILLISAEEGVTEQDTKIIGIAHERGKAAIIVVNKWDLIEKDNHTMKKYENQIRTELAYMPYAPIMFISALSGQRVTKIFDTAKQVAQNAALRISTGILNDVLIEALALNPPAAVKGRFLRVYYVTQVSVKPPTFILFVNDVHLMHFSYKRYIENQFRKAFGFIGTPIHFIVRAKEKD